MLASNIRDYISIHSNVGCPILERSISNLKCDWIADQILGCGKVATLNLALIILIRSVIAG